MRTMREDETRGRGCPTVYERAGIACVSCGAAPGTLRGIQDDLLADPSISRIRFNIGMLEWFNEIQREFVVKHGGVTFC